jgi:hypothetical protein
VHGVLAQVVEQGLLVDPDQLVDQPPVRGVPEALAHPGGDRGDLVQHGRVDEGALVGAARGPAAAERGELIPGRGRDVHRGQAHRAEQVCPVGGGEVQVVTAERLGDRPAVPGGRGGQRLQEHTGADVPERDAEVLGREPPVQVVEHLGRRLARHPHHDRLRVVRGGVVPGVVQDR